MLRQPVPHRDRSYSDLRTFATANLRREHAFKLNAVVSAAAAAANHPCFFESRSRRMRTRNTVKRFPAPSEHAFEQIRLAPERPTDRMLVAYPDDDQMSFSTAMYEVELAIGQKTGANCEIASCMLHHRWLAGLFSTVLSLADDSLILQRWARYIVAVVLRYT